jgi:hypothetical protein
MRTVIADTNLARRDVVRHAVISDPAYQLVGEAATLEHCAELVARELPELAICGELPLPSSLTPEQPFPLVIAIGRSGDFESQRLVCEVPDSPCASHVANALAVAAARILAAKAGDLSRLIHRYLAHGGSQPEGLDRITVDRNGQRITLSPEDILWIESSGNYVQLHTAAGSFLMRSPISSIAARLEPFGFTRIHRCILVNASAIDSRNMMNGKLTSLMLRDGTHLQVGPKFRDCLPGDERAVVQ